MATTLAPYQAGRLNLLRKQVAVAAKADTIGQRRFEAAKDNARRANIQTLWDYWATYFRVRRFQDRLAAIHPVICHRFQVEISMIQRARKIAPLLLLVLVGHILCPLLFILQMRGVPRHDLLAWMLSLYVAGSYVAFIYLAGAWSWFGKVTRSALPVLLFAVAIATYPFQYADIRAPTLWLSNQ